MFPISAPPRDHRMVDTSKARCCDGSVSDTTTTSNALPVNAALCVEQETLTRLGRILRHLAVGLVDQSVSLRLLSCDPRVESLSLGPIQTIVHEKLRWPVARRHLKRLIEVLSHQPPTVVHAMSAGSYRNAALIAKEFDADLVLHVTSLEDCDAMAGAGLEGVGYYIAISQPLQGRLVDQVGVTPEDIELIRPGILAPTRTACFSDTSRVPALLCTSDLERGGGVDVLIETVDLLRKRHINVMVFLLGKGSWERTLRRRIHRQGLSPFFTIASPMGDLSQAMQSADLFVRPSVDSAFFVNGLMAMAVGAAIVTFENTACDHYRDGETAIICPEPTAACLADTIERLIQEPAYTRSIATRGQQHIETNHAMSAMAERTAAVYRRLALKRATISIRE